MRRLVLVALLACATGCLGGGPVFSSADGGMFLAPPAVVERSGRYRLVWTQGSFPFFFVADVEVVDGRVIVAVRGSSSSGMLVGRLREQPIDDEPTIRALARGAGAYFWEPEPRPRGRLVPLVVRHEP